MRKNLFIKKKFLLQNFFLYNSVFFDKLVSCFHKKGKKEKLEKKFFIFFKKFDFFLFYELLFAIKPLVKLYFLKKRSGRHTFFYTRKFRPLPLNFRYNEATTSLFKMLKLKSKNFCLKEFSKFFLLTIINKNIFRWSTLLKSAFFVSHKGGMRHFRWSIKNR